VIGFEDFHFLRPLWLLAIATLIPLIWRAARARRSAGEWERICDPELLEHLLVPGAGRATRWPTLFLALGWIAACIALAGPSWERLPQQTYRAPTQTVAVLDLSTSMLSRDVAPSRLARARFELLDLLDRVDGAVGLVIFSDEPYAVTPLTDDPRVIAELVPTLTPDLMPGRGKRLDRAIDRARELLEQAGATRGRVVVLSDGLGSAPEAARDSARRSADAGYQVSALALGEGALALESLVRLGGGHFAHQTADDSDIEWLLASDADGDLLSFGDASHASVDADAWRDEGPWLLLIPLLLAPLAFRKGWATALGVVFLIGLQAPRAEAAEGTLFQRADELGASAFAEGRHAEAAELFEDPEWRAAAQYRSGDYAGAVASLQGRDDAGSLYNLGNALARDGQLEEAIAAYDQALEQAPDDEDAAHNRELVKRLLEEQQNEPEPQPDASSNESSDSSESGEPGAPDASQSSSNDDSEASGESDESEASASAKSSASESEDSEGDDAQSDDSEGQGSDADASAGETPTDSAAQTGSGSEAEFPPDDGGDPSAGSEANDNAANAVDPRSETDHGDPSSTTASAGAQAPLSESDQEIEQWLNRVPDDPGGLLREKLRRRYARQRYGAHFETHGPTTSGGRFR
jgi:Ca-activated chloride channel family protein